MNTYTFTALNRTLVIEAGTRISAYSEAGAWLSVQGQMYHQHFDRWVRVDKEWGNDGPIKLKAVYRYHEPNHEETGDYLRKEVSRCQGRTEAWRLTAERLRRERDLYRNPLIVSDRLNLIEGAKWKVDYIKLANNLLALWDQTQEELDVSEWALAEARKLISKIVNAVAEKSVAGGVLLMDMGLHPIQLNEEIRNQREESNEPQ